MHPHCQEQIDAHNAALKPYRRVRLLQDYARKRKAATTGESAAWWQKQLDVLGPCAARLGSTNNKTEKALLECLRAFGGSDLVTEPAEEEAPRDDDQFALCMRHAPTFAGDDWL